MWSSNLEMKQHVDNRNILARVPNSEVREELSILWVRVIEEKSLGGPYGQAIRVQ
jgi:hypothetical protein